MDHQPLPWPPTFPLTPPEVEREGEAFSVSFSVPGNPRGKGRPRTAVIAGRAELLADWALHLPPELEAVKATAEAAGRTAVAAGWDGRPRAVLVVADAIKATSAEAIAQLRGLGLRPVLLTRPQQFIVRPAGRARQISPGLPSVRGGPGPPLQ